MLGIPVGEFTSPLPLKPFGGQRPKWSVYVTLLSPAVGATVANMSRRWHGTMLTNRLGTVNHIDSFQ